MYNGFIHLILVRFCNSKTPSDFLLPPFPSSQDLSKLVSTFTPPPTPRTGGMNFLPWKKWRIPSTLVTQIAWFLSLMDVEGFLPLLAWSAQFDQKEPRNRFGRWQEIFYIPSRTRIEFPRRFIELPFLQSPRINMHSMFNFYQKQRRSTHVQFFLGESTTQELRLPRSILRENVKAGGQIQVRTP